MEKRNTDPQQLGLYDRPAAFQRDSETSRAAAVSVRGNAKSYRTAVLAYLRGRGPHGATNSEMSEALGMQLSTVCARCNELQKKNLVIDSGNRRKTATGRSATVWIAETEIMRQQSFGVKL